MASSGDERYERIMADMDQLKKQMADLITIIARMNMTIGTLGDSLCNSGREQQQRPSKSREKDGHRESQTGGSSRSAERKRQFSNLGEPLSKIFEELQAQGLLQPSPARHQVIPAKGDRNLYCRFHQVYGHSTDSCVRLKNEIQDLIDARRIADPDSK